MARQSNWNRIATMLIAGSLAIPAFGQTVFYVKNGNAGVGTSNPTETMHVRGSDGDTQLFVHETSGTSTRRTLARIVNNGPADFSISDGNHSWSIGNRGSGFQVNKGGTGVVEFKVDANGDGRFVGDVYADGVKLTSSRLSKTDFESIDALEILRRLASIEISSWRYHDRAEKHIGPVAEDFAEAFGFDDDSHISMIDASGVALASIQALQSIVDKQADQIRSLEERIVELAGERRR